MGEYTYHVDRGRIPFPPRFLGILDKKPVLFYDSDQGCLVLYGEREMKRYKISPPETYSYTLHDGRLFLPHNVWLKSIGIVDEVAVIGAMDHVQLWDSKKKEAEKEKDGILRNLVLEVAMVSKPCVITTFEGLEVYPIKIWKKLVEEDIVGVRPDIEKGRRIQRHLFSQSYRFESFPEFLKFYYSGEGDKLLAKNRA